MRVVRLLLTDTSGNVPVKPFPTKCTVLRDDTENKHDGIEPWNEGRLLLPHLDPTPIPSSIRLDRFDEHIFDERVPVIQLDDRTNVFRLGKLNSDEGIDPVRLIEDISIYCKLLEVLELNRDVILPPRSTLSDRLMLTSCSSVSMLDGIKPSKLLSCMETMAIKLSSPSSDGIVPVRLLL